MKTTFKSDLRLLFIELIKKFFLFTLFCYTIIALIQRGTPALPFLLLSAIIAFVLSAVWAFWWRNIRIELDYSDIHFFRWSHEYAVYPLAEVNGLRSTRHYYNGIFGSTARQIHFPGKRANKIINCSCINADDFAQLGLSVNQLRQKNNAGSVSFESIPSALANAETPKVNAASSNTVTSSFTIASKDYLRVECKILRQVTLSLVIAGVLLSILWYIGLYCKAPHAYGNPLRLMLSIALSFPAFSLIFYGIRILFLRPRLCSSFEFRDYSITLNEHTYAANEITRLAMTPMPVRHKSTNPIFGTLYIHMKHGSSKYYIGLAPNAAPPALLPADYETLVNHTADWCERNRVPFISKF